MNVFSTIQLQLPGGDILSGEISAVGETMPKVTIAFNGKPPTPDDKARIIRTLHALKAGGAHKNPVKSAIVKGFLDAIDACQGL